MSLHGNSLHYSHLISSQSITHPFQRRVGRLAKPSDTVEVEVSGLSHEPPATFASLYPHVAVVSPPSCAARGPPNPRKVLSTSCLLYSLFTGPTFPWLPLEIIPARTLTLSPFSKHCRFWNPPVGVKRREGAGNESRPGMLTTLLIGKDCGFSVPPVFDDS